ncbi:MAG: acyl-CoA dehydrogenase [Alphaproteobacteria bacterium]|jgi:alkylation response protein AidB-like acyl-CoA dehydrogenase|nr:acyl-CoA dehydrogenase [Alphaproteobacteria bacterium]MBT4085918.1 acyl-CoA dehydrogenase [Alphaproteobacteria bacterium]MBT4542609.1 acyl-CoA dehydrogenase [Alphaproteobacteria bacterium]MBT7746813.1 acyl-CoA dehydrogenase [Alphaproteobacteria bacterium]
MLGSLPLVSIPPEDEALRPAVRAFLKDALKGRPRDVLARSWVGLDADFSRKLAAKGWVGITFPEEYGGGGRSPYARFVLVEELLNAGAPVYAHWIADRQSGPLILKYGTDAQKDFYLPKICKGEAFFCIGMSEPTAGSDLASVRTRAVKTDNGWLLNGQKIWTSGANISQYMVALVRTSGEPEDRNKGLSQIIIDMSLPGIDVRPIKDMSGDSHFNEVFFDDVVLAEDALVGTEGQGWQQVTSELAFERSGPERIYSSIQLLDGWLDYLKSRPVISEASTVLIGKFATHLAVLRAMSLAITDQLTKGLSPATEAALVKDMGTEVEQAIPTLIADALASEPDAPVPDELLRTLEYVTLMSPTFSLRGGTREILRGIIARGLGLR